MHGVGVHHVWPWQLPLRALRPLVPHDDEVLRRSAHRAGDQLVGRRGERARDLAEEGGLDEEAEDACNHTWCTRSAVHQGEGAQCGSAPCVVLQDAWCVLEVPLEVDEGDLHVAPAGERALRGEAGEGRADDDDVPGRLSRPEGGGAAQPVGRVVQDGLEREQEHVGELEARPHEEDGGLDHDRTKPARAPVRRTRCGQQALSLVCRRTRTRR